MRGAILFEIQVKNGVASWGLLLFLLLSLILWTPNSMSQSSQVSKPMSFSSLFPFVEPENSPIAFDDRLGLGTDLLGVADFNEDGFIDLVGSSRTSLQILFGNGQGQFSVGSITFINAALRTFGDAQVLRPIEDESFFSMDSDIVDFNNDGHLDLVLLGTVLISNVHSPEDVDTIVPSQKRLYVFLGDGQGQLTLAFTPIALDEDRFASKIVTTDVTGDDIVDVLLIALGQHTFDTGNTNPFSLFPGMGQGRLGALEIPSFTFLPFSGGIKHTTAQDINQDGLIDVLVRFDHEIDLLQGDTQMGFTFQKLVITAEDSFIGQAFLSDVNNDGRTELGVVINQAELQIFALNEDGATLMQTQTINGPINQVFIGDLNADQIPDMITTGFSPQVFSIALGEGDGHFDTERPTRYALKTPFNNIFIHDLTANGRNDLLFTTPFLPLMLLNQEHPQGVAQIPMVQSLLLGQVDFDADGDVDFIGGVGQQLEVFVNNGQGAFSSTLISLGTSSFLTSGVAADLDEDGRDEFLILGISNNEVLPVIVLSVLGTNAQTGQFEERTFFNLEYDGGMPNFEVGDFNGDGHLDALTTGKQSIVLWFGDGGGQLTPQHFGVDGQVGVVTVQDVDHDDASEIIAVLTQESATFKLFDWQQDQLVETETLVTTQTTPLLMKSSDFNADGFQDILALSVEMNASEQGEEVVVEIPSARLIEFLNDGQGGFKVTETVIGHWDLGTIPWPITGLAVGDFNQDSDQDVAFTMQQGAPVRVLTGAGNRDLSIEAKVPCRGAPLFVADLDGNGQQELITSTMGFPTLCIAWNAGGLR